MAEDMQLIVDRRGVESVEQPFHCVVIMVR